MEFSSLLYVGVAVAVVTTLAASSLAGWLGRGGDSPSGPRWGAALGLGLGALLAHETVREELTNSRPGPILRSLIRWAQEGGDFPLAAWDAIYALPWALLGALVIGLFDADFPTPRWARWENRALLIALVMWLILGPLVGGALEPWPAARWMLGLGVGIFAWWTLLDVQAERIGSGMPLVLFLSAAALPKAMLDAQAAVLAVLSVAFAAVVGALWVVSWFHRRMNLARGAIPVFAANVSGLLVCAVFYNDMLKSAALLLALAPLASFVDRIGPLARLSPRKRAAVRALAVGVVAGAAYACPLLLPRAREA